MKTEDRLKEYCSRDALTTMALYNLMRRKGIVTKRLWAIFFLSVFDALATVYLLGHGMQELNPVLKPLVGSPWFWVVKIGVTATACWGLNRLARDGKRWFSKAMNAMLGGYAVLAVYELVCIWRVS